MKQNDSQSLRDVDLFLIYPVPFHENFTTIFLIEFLCNWYILIHEIQENIYQ